MEDLADKDKEIGILKSQYRTATKENEVLKMDISRLEHEIEKLRLKVDLTDDDEYNNFLFGSEMNNK